MTCSPYLERPLRTLEQAREQIARKRAAATQAESREVRNGRAT